MTVIAATVGLSIAHADEKTFKQKHPRRAEVLGRAKNEKNKNNAAAANGKITNAQAKQLDRQDNRIMKQEQRQAAANGGHITKAEQAQDNREENHVNQERRADEKADAAGGGAPAGAPPAGGN